MALPTQISPISHLVNFPPQRSTADRWICWPRYRIYYDRGISVLLPASGLLLVIGLDSDDVAAFNDWPRTVMCYVVIPGITKTTWNIAYFHMAKLEHGGVSGYHLVNFGKIYYYGATWFHMANNDTFPNLNNIWRYRHSVPPHGLFCWLELIV